MSVNINQRKFNSQIEITDLITLNQTTQTAPINPRVTSSKKEQKISAIEYAGLLLQFSSLSREDLLARFE